MLAMHGQLQVLENNFVVDEPYWNLLCLFGPSYLFMKLGALVEFLFADGKHILC